MKPTLVTGANGHLGNNLCRLLVDRGERVRAMIRATADPAPLAGLDLEVVRGDILDAAGTARAVEGCARVYHTAAGFLLWARDPERDIIRPSVEGTRNVMEAAARAGVEKVLYTSTMGTIGFPDTPGQSYDERRFNGQPHTYYLHGKIAAEREAFAIAARSRTAITSIHPGYVLGPRFWKLSESLRFVAQFLNQGAPVYMDGGFGVVDVEDVAQGAILAMERGGDRERYILSGENLTVRELLALMAELSGLPAPRLKLPLAAARLLAPVLELSALVGARPMIDRRQLAEFGARYVYGDSGKAERELGYSSRPARETVARTIAWLLARGFVGARRLRALRPHPSLAPLRLAAASAEVDERAAG